MTDMIEPVRKTQADFDHQRANGWPDFHPEDFCHRCGMPNICWGTPAEVWNPVMRPEGHGTETWLWNEIICPVCFVQLAQAKCERGVVWELRIETIPHEGARQFAELVEVYAREGRAKPAALAATYTASEVKVLTETATKVAYALGRKDAGEEIAQALEEYLPYYSEEFFPAGGTSVDCIAAKAMRHAYPNAARIARETVSQPQDATSDATSGVGGHQEVSEAARSPQEPCGCRLGPIHTEADHRDAGLRLRRALKSLRDGGEDREDA